MTSWNRGPIVERETQASRLPALSLLRNLRPAQVLRGKVATGLLQLFTAGGLGLWWLVDLIVILLGGFRDKEGRLITKWV